MLLLLQKEKNFLAFSTKKHYIMLCDAVAFMIIIISSSSTVVLLQKATSTIRTMNYVIIT
jgi:hypothetical protein